MRTKKRKTKKKLVKKKRKPRKEKLQLNELDTAVIQYLDRVLPADIMVTVKHNLAIETNLKAAREKRVNDLREQREKDTKAIKLAKFRAMSRVDRQRIVDMFTLEDLYKEVEEAYAEISPEEIELDRIIRNDPANQNGFLTSFSHGLMKGISRDRFTPNGVSKQDLLKVHHEACAEEDLCGDA